MTAMTRISALSTILALGLWVGPAAAGDINTDSPAADDTLVANGDQLDPSQLNVRLVPVRPVPEAAEISIGRISVFRQSGG